MQIGDYIDLCKKPYLKIWCRARGIGGEVYCARKYKDTDQTEYLYYDEKNKKLKWLNDNGYCKFEKIENITR